MLCPCGSLHGQSMRVFGAYLCGSAILDRASAVWRFAPPVRLWRSDRNRIPKRQSAAWSGHAHCSTARPCCKNPHTYAVPRPRQPAPGARTAARPDHAAKTRMSMRFAVRGSRATGATCSTARPCCKIPHNYAVPGPETTKPGAQKPAATAHPHPIGARRRQPPDRKPPNPTPATPPAACNYNISAKPKGRANPVRR